MKSGSVKFLGAKKSRLSRIGKLICLLGMASLIVVSLFAGCTTEPEDNNGDEITPTPPKFPMEITDYAGRLVRIEAEPQKIVSLAPSNTEIVYALGLEDRLVGVTTYCDYPEAAKDKPKIGGFTTVDIEKVLEIQPDLILAANIHISEIVPVLEGFDLTVLVLDAKTLDEVLLSITLAGKCTGREDKASQLVGEMEKRISAITDKTANLTEAQIPCVFYITWHDPLMTVGGESRHDELIQLAGGINAFHDLTEMYPVVSLEAVIISNPEVIVAGIGMGAMEQEALQFALNDPRISGIEARINNRIYGLDIDLTGRAGPRIVEALEQLAKMIHPEIFGPIG